MAGALSPSSARARCTRLCGASEAHTGCPPRRTPKARAKQQRQQQFAEQWEHQYERMGASVWFLTWYPCSCCLSMIASNSSCYHSLCPLLVCYLRPSLCHCRCGREKHGYEPSGFHPRQWEHDAAASATSQNAEPDIDQVVATVHEGTR